MRRRAARGPGPSPDRRVARVRRSRYDGEILRLALPALGALAAEPLYLLVDTAIVGHLGTPQLAALALAATVLSNLVALCIFLTYGTTARVTRLHGAGRDADAAALGAAGAVARARRGGRGRRRRVGVRRAARERAGRRRARRRHVGALPAHRRARAADGARRAGGSGLAARHRATCAPRSSSWWRPTSSTSCSRCCSSTASAGAWTGRRGARCSRNSGWGSRSRSCCCAPSPGPTSSGSARSCSIGAQLVVRTAALLGCFVLATAVCARIGAATRRGPPDRLPALRLPGARARRDRDRRAGHRRPRARRRRGGRGLRRRAPHARAVARGRARHRRRLPRPRRRDPARVHRAIPASSTRPQRAVATVLCDVAGGRRRLRARRHPHRRGRHALPGGGDGRGLRRLPADRPLGRHASPWCGWGSTSSCSCASRRSAGASCAAAGRSSARTPSWSRARSAPAAGSRCARSPPRWRR